MAAATLPTKLEELRFERPEAFPEYRSACKMPPMVREDSTPTDVILGWAGWETTRATLAAATLPTRLEELRLDNPDPFPVKRLAVKKAMLAVVTTLMFEQSRLETAAFAAFRIPTFETLDLRRLKNAVLAPRPPVTLAVVNQPAPILAVPETLRFTRVPKLVIFDWVFESWRDVRGPTRFEEVRLERPEPFPV